MSLIVTYCRNFASKSGGTKLLLPTPPLLSLAVKEKKWGYAYPRTPVGYAYDGITGWKFKTESITGWKFKTESMRCEIC
jgi:hypothetical protein